MSSAHENASAEPARKTASQKRQERIERIRAIKGETLTSREIMMAAIVTGALLPGIPYLVSVALGVIGFNGGLFGFLLSFGIATGLFVGTRSALHGPLVRNGLAYVWIAVQTLAMLIYFVLGMIGALIGGLFAAWS